MPNFIDVVGIVEQKPEYCKYIYSLQSGSIMNVACSFSW